MHEADIDCGSFVPDVSIMDEVDLEDDVTKITTCLVAVEILSPADHEALGNEGRSRIELKVEGYKNLQSCQAVLLVDQSTIEIIVVTRSENGWSENSFNSADDVIKLPAFGLKCTLAEIYARTPALRAALVPGRRP